MAPPATLVEDRAFDRVTIRATIAMTLHLGMVGLGRMGASMAKRLARGGVAVVGFDLDPDARAAFAGVEGCQSVDSLEERVHALPPMRVGAALRATSRASGMDAAADDPDR